MLTLVALTALAACTQSPTTPPQAGVQNAVPSIEQGILNPGGSFTSSAGVTIRAPTGVLNAPVEVFAKAITSSTFPLPLPGAWSQVGSAYRIGATGGAGSRNRDSFQIELPVPAGVDSRGLAIATFFPTSFPVDGEDQPPYWDSATTQRTSGLSVLQTVARELNSASFIYVLVRRNDVLIQSKPSSVITQATPVFTVTCEGSFPCNQTLKSEAISVTATAYSDFVSSMGLDGTNLPLVDTNIKFILSGTLSCRVNTSTVAGYYNFLDTGIRLCVNSTGQPVVTAYQNTLRHEVFHAVQAGILASVGVTLTRQWIDDGRLWIIEGTAQAASVSLSQMNVRSDTNLNLARRIVPSLLSTSSDLTYQTQDYWAYVGRVLNRGIVYTKAIFQTGLSDPIPNVNSSLIALGYSGGLFQSHWDWIKNQTVERSVNLRGTPASCRMDLATVGTQYTDFPIVFNFASSALAPVTRSVNILPLGGRAVKVQFPGAAGGVVRVRITPTNAIP